MERVRIGSNYIRQPLWKVLIAVPLIYIPLITTVPFMIIGVLLVRVHLKWVGGVNIRKYSEFVPCWASHRYRYSNQITYATDTSWLNFRAYRFFWVFNCKLYCPLTVGLFKYAVYLVEIVENWWCPFEHDKKASYSNGAIDKSYWHLYDEDLKKLHPDDQNNPIWNEQSSQDKSAEA